MKKALALILALILVCTLFSACGTPEAPEAEAAPAESESNGKYRVAVITGLSDMYGAWMKLAYEQGADEYDNLEVTIMDATSDPSKWISNLEDCVTEKYDYIVAQGTWGDQGTTVQKCLDADIPVIFMNYLEPWMATYGCTVICSNYQLGYLCGERAAKDLPENANVVIINGFAGNEITAARRQGFADGLANRDDITILDEQYADYDTATAMSKMEDWLQVYGQDEIDGVLCMSDSMCTGAIEAYSSAGLDSTGVFFSGLDGLTDACNYILAGQMNCSAQQDATMYSKLSYDLIQRDISGEIDLITYREDVVFDPILIDSSNAQEMMDFYTENGLVQ